MNGYVTTTTPKVEDTQTVTLELSVIEFAVLRHLQRQYLGGTGDTRKRIETVFTAVETGLNQDNRQLVQRADFAGTTSSGWSSVQRIEKVFSERT